MDYDGMLKFVEKNCYLALSTHGYTEKDLSPQLNDRSSTGRIVSA